jgi:flavorubredoxin
MATTTPTIAAPTLATEPVEIAAETFLIPHLVPAEPGTYLSVNSMVIRADEPVIVDTGAPIHRDTWLEKVFSLVEPEDVRWLFLSHDDGDHRGSLQAVLERCPNATLVTNFFSVERILLEEDLPVDRMIWREPGDSFCAGDRELHLVRPPIFDGPTTRGLYDPTTGALWAVDSFVSLTTGASPWVEDVPEPLYDETMRVFNSMVSPWHAWLDPERYGSHVRSVQALKPRVVASAHGPVHTSSATIDDAFARVAALAGQPISAGPGQEALDAMLAASMG